MRSHTLDASLRCVSRELGTADMARAAGQRGRRMGAMDGSMTGHARGILLITLSAVAFSSVGFFTRLIHLDAWTMLFWRGWFAGVMILCVIAARERSNTWEAIRAIGRPGLVVAVCSSAATI